MTTISVTDDDFRGPRRSGYNLPMPAYEDVSETAGEKSSLKPEEPQASKVNNKVKPSKKCVHVSCAFGVVTVGTNLLTAAICLWLVPGLFTNEQQPTSSLPAFPGGSFIVGRTIYYRNKTLDNWAVHNESCRALGMTLVDDEDVKALFENNKDEMGQTVYWTAGSKHNADKTKTGYWDDATNRNLPQDLNWYGGDDTWDPQPDGNGRCIYVDFRMSDQFRYVNSRGPTYWDDSCEYKVRAICKKTV